MRTEVEAAERVLRKGNGKGFQKMLLVAQTREENRDKGRQERREGQRERERERERQRRLGTGKQLREARELMVVGITFIITVTLTLEH